MTKFIRMSPNEIQQLELNDYNQKRTRRLLEVREQEKKNAAQRRHRYKKAHEQVWSLVLSELQDNHVQTKESQLKELLDLQEKRRQEMGLAMNEAHSQEESKKVHVTSYRQTLVRDQKIQDIRFLTSLKYSKQQEYERLHPLLEKKALLEEIARKEQERAKKLAKAYRDKLARGEITNIEIPPCPVGRWERDHMKAFDETCFHRDFAAVKCETNLQENIRQDAWDAAKEAEREAIELQAKKTIHLQKLKESEDKRKQKALKGLQMDQERLQLDKEMEELLLEDKKRRQENAGAYASVFRPLYPELGESTLKAKFENQFNIGDDGEDDQNQTTSYAPFKKPQDRPKKEDSLEDSIEFIEENAPLQVIKPISK